MDTIAPSYEPKEVKRYFWKCTECDWSSEAVIDECDLEVVELCPECKTSWIGLDSDWFQE